MYLNINSSSDRSSAPERLPNRAPANQHWAYYHLGFRRQDSVGGEYVVAVEKNYSRDTHLNIIIISYVLVFSKWLV